MQHYAKLKKLRKNNSKGKTRYNYVYEDKLKDFKVDLTYFCVQVFVRTPPPQL